VREVNTLDPFYLLLLHPINAEKVIHGREKHTGGTKRENNNTSKGRIKGRCFYFVWTLPFNLSELGGPTRSIKTPARIAIWINEIRNTPITKR